jgi:hypothetical protein
MFKTQNKHCKRNTYIGNLKLREAQVRHEWGRIYEQEEVEGARIGELIASYQTKKTAFSPITCSSVTVQMQMYELLEKKIQAKINQTQKLIYEKGTNFT